MISEAAKRISAYLVENGAGEDDAEVLSYGAECFLNMLIADGLLIIIGLLTHHVVYLLVWSVSFSVLRTNLGGLHASSHFWCILIGTAIGASSIIVSPFWAAHTAIAAVFTAGAVVTAVAIAPVPHKNKRHIQSQKTMAKVKVAAAAAVECALTGIFYFSYPMIAAYIVSGMVMATVLAVAGMMFNPR